MVPTEANYHESKVPQYKLPDPLITTSGNPISDPSAWTCSPGRWPHNAECFDEDGPNSYGALAREAMLDVRCSDES